MSMNQPGVRRSKRQITEAERWRRRLGMGYYVRSTLNVLGIGALLMANALSDRIDSAGVEARRELVRQMRAKRRKRRTR